MLRTTLIAFALLLAHPVGAQVDLREGDVDDASERLRSPARVTRFFEIERKLDAVQTEHRGADFFSP